MIRSYKGAQPKIAASAFVETSAQVIGDVEIGDNSSIWFNCVLRGDVHYIKIGRNSNVQDGSVIHVTNGRFPTVIGDCVTVGHGVMLHGCTIDGHTLIGIGSIILDDARIGEQCIIAAGSVVPPGAMIPPKSLAMGSPAKVRREVTDAELERIEQNWKNYVEYKAEYLAENQV